MLAAAERIMVERKIKKLPLVDADGRLLGLVTSRDLLRQRRLPVCDARQHGRLRVGAAIGARGDFLERAAELLRAGADALSSTSRTATPSSWSARSSAADSGSRDAELIAGNVATADGARFLLERGAMR